MGCFDNVKFSYPCPNCGTIIEKFQSKDKLCISDILEWWEVNNFYGSCPQCDYWLEFDLEDTERIELPPKKFKLKLIARERSEREKIEDKIIEKRYENNQSGNEE